MNLFKNNDQTAGGNTLYKIWAPMVSTTQIVIKVTPNIGIVPITSLLGAFNNLK